MASDVRHLNPAGLLDAGAFGFSQLSVAPAGNVVHIAGQTAADERGRYDPGADLTEQTRRALRNLTIALDAANASTRDLVALRVYIVELERSMFSAVSPEIAAFLAGATPPPATWVGVTSLLSPDALIEIEAVAVVAPP